MSNCLGDPMSNLSLKCQPVHLLRAVSHFFSAQGPAVSSPRTVRGWRLLTSLFTGVLLLLPTTVVQAQTLIVTNVSDDTGTGSLRDAITQANASSGATIVFDVPGLGGTIVLQSALPTINQSTTIVGSGANLLTVSGNHLYPIFSISSGTVAISGLAIANGFGANGGAILNNGTLTVSNSIFSGNAASNFGGAIASAGTLTVNDSTFSGNSATGGGALYTQAQLTVSNSTFSGNSAGSSYGGAICNTAMLAVTNSTFSGNSGAGNSTSGFGGGIYNNTGGTAIANNNVFSGNTALLGAGIQNSNTANSSGAVANNNVFYNNLSGGSESDCSDCTTNSNAIDGDPKLAPLGNYGGTTATMLPLPGSAAICAGSYALAVNAQSAPLTTDERGFVMDSLCVDAGAVQTNYLMVTNTQDDGGARSLRACWRRLTVTPAGMSPSTRLCSPVRRRLRWAVRCRRWLGR
jgi:predicted outer membrane repeat protein